MLGLLSSSCRGFKFSHYQRLPFTFHTQLNLNLTSYLPLMASTNLPAFSTGSPSPSPATTKRVGTHNGSFHCDEALGCFMIRLTDKFSNAEIVRTRDPQVSHFSIFIFCLVPRKTVGIRVREKKGVLFGILEKKGFSFFHFCLWGCRFWRVSMLSLMLGVYMILVEIVMIITRKGFKRFLVTVFLPN